MINSKVRSITNQQTEEDLQSELSLFREFYLDHHRVVSSVLYRFGVVTDLEDLVQETFLKAWRSREQFLGQATARTWLIRIALNTAIDRGRKQAPADVPLNLVHNKPDQASLSQELEMSELVKKALKQLKIDSRIVIVLHLMEGYSLREISGILEIPEGTVKSRLHQAKKDLHQIFQSLGVEL